MIAVALSRGRRRRAHSGRLALILILLVGLSSGCSVGDEQAGGSGLESRSSQPGESDARVRISLIGTNDLHGQIESLPLFSGYLANLRSAREAEGGAVVLVDAGDLFQGTLATNKDEGRGMIATYNSLAYDAMSLGNHDFDYGAIGPRPDERPDQDPQGALKARAREANFAFLSANLRREGGAPLGWSEVGASVLLDKAGIRVGIVGAVGEHLATIIRSSDFRGLELGPTAPSIVREARRLREQGAQVVIAVVHAGGACERFDDSADAGSCDLEHEIFRIARDIEPGLVDVIVAGHRHDAIAHEFNGMAIIQSYSTGQAFGRVDLTLVSGKLTEVEIHPPHWLCPTGDDPRSCDPGDYEGQRVERDALLMEQVLEAEKEALALASERLGVRVTGPFARSQVRESALGNLFVDMMRLSYPDVDIAIQNGGVLRAGIGAGDLRYGDVYRAMSLENFFAVIPMSAADLRRDLTRSLSRDHDMISISGARLVVRCDDGDLVVDILGPEGRPIPDERELRILTSDYLAAGGDDLFSVAGREDAIEVFDDRPIVIDEVVKRLRERGGFLDGEDPVWFDPLLPRIVLPAPPPINCSQLPEPAGWPIDVETGGPRETSFGGESAYP